MQPWYRELNQRNRLLMVAASATLDPRLTVTEFAVLTVLVNQGDRMGVSRRSLLWQRGRGCSMLERADRDGAAILPYTRQGIEKACKGLIARGWIREDWSTTYERRDPGLTVLSLNILSVAPSWLQPNSVGSSPKDPKATPVGRKSAAEKSKPTTVASRKIPKAATGVAQRSLRNKRSKSPVGSKGDRSKPALATPESAADHDEAGPADYWQAHPDDSGDPYQLEERVEVVSVKHPRFGQQGTVKAVTVRDEVCVLFDGEPEKSPRETIPFIAVNPLTTRIQVQVERVEHRDAGEQYHCREVTGKGPPAFYPVSSFSMPGAARAYAAKVAARFLECDVDSGELRPTHHGKGRYSYQVDKVKGGGRG